VDFEAILSRVNLFLIAKLCDVNAVDNLARHDVRVSRLLRYRLALVCGGASDLTKSEELLAQFGVTEDQLRLIRYRGYGNPGPTRGETEDDRAYEVSYRQLWEDESKWMIQPRCKICPDAIGEAADIVASDMWSGGGPTGEDEEFNGIIKLHASWSRAIGGRITAERSFDGKIGFQISGSCSTTSTT
jgi:coenzyme F420 hydrogenase subunit beta